MRTQAPDPALTRDTEALHSALSELVRVYQFRDRDRICCHDVSVTQCYALEVLVARGSSTLNALAADLYLDKSTASRVVGALERKGYVQRSPHPQDGRAVLLAATGTGKRLCSRIEAELVAETRELARDLDPRERAGAAKLLLRLARAAQARSGVGPGCCAPEEPLHESGPKA